MPIINNRSHLSEYHFVYLTLYIMLSPLLVFIEFNSLNNLWNEISVSKVSWFIPVITITIFVVLLYAQYIFDEKPNYPRYNNEYDSLIPLDMKVLKNTFTRWGKSEVERSVPNKVGRDSLYFERKRILDFPQFTDKTMCDICKKEKGTILRQCMHVLCTDCVSVKCDNDVCKGRGKIDISYYINYEKKLIWEYSTYLFGKK